jgi:hypothetical protein
MADALPEQTMNKAPWRLILGLWKSMEGLEER